MTSLTQQAKDYLTQQIHSGDIVIDATAGNGFDTAFLAKQVGQTGMVYAFDIQQQAITETQRLLEAESLTPQVTLHLKSHAQMKQTIPEKYHQKISIVMFNLGYLPGSDKTCITTATSTIPALQQCVELLKDDGALSIMLYPGHPGGQTETKAVLEWIKKLPDHWPIKQVTTPGPHWLLIHKVKT